MIVCTEASGAASIRAEAAPFFSFSGVKDGIKNAYLVLLRILSKVCLI